MFLGNNVDLTENFVEGFKEEIVDVCGGSHGIANLRGDVVQKHSLGRCVVLTVPVIIPSGQTETPVLHVLQVVGELERVRETVQHGCAPSGTRSFWVRDVAMLFHSTNLELLMEESKKGVHTTRGREFGIKDTGGNTLRVAALFFSFIYVTVLIGMSKEGGRCKGTPIVVGDPTHANRNSPVLKGNGTHLRRRRQGGSRADGQAAEQLLEVGDGGVAGSIGVGF